VGLRLTIAHNAPPGWRPVRFVYYRAHFAAQVAACALSFPDTHNAPDDRPVAVSRNPAVRTTPGRVDFPAPRACSYYCPAEKWSCRFFCQQLSVASVHTGRSFP